MSHSDAVHTTKHNPTKQNLKCLSKDDRIKCRAKAFRLFEDGLGYRAVSSMLNLSVYTVRDWARLFKTGNFDPQIKHPGKYSQNLSTQEIRDQVKAEYENGASISYLSVKYGKNKTTVRYWLRKNR